MPVSLKAAKSARVQLLAGVEDLGMDSHRCVRTAARSTDEFIGPFIWQSCARGYCLSHKALLLRTAASVHVYDSIDVIDIKPIAINMCSVF